MLEKPIERRLSTPSSPDVVEAISPKAWSHRDAPTRFSNSVVYRFLRDLQDGCAIGCRR